MSFLWVLFLVFEHRVGESMMQPVVFLLDAHHSAIREISEPSHAISLLQNSVSRLHARMPTHGRQDLFSDSECVPLKNKNTMYSLEVNVGTPKQTFELLPDTGSKDVLIPSCDCMSAGLCGDYHEDVCFDHNASSSFTKVDLSTKLVNGRLIDPWAPTVSWGVQKSGTGELYLKKEYGTATLSLSQGTDIASVGGASAKLEQGILLMQERKLAADFKGNPDTFQGLLGLGVPVLNSSEPLFMRQAGVSRYSLCFNAAFWQGVKTPGVLRMNVPALVKPLGTVLGFHWAVELQGVSVGDSTSALWAKHSNEPWKASKVTSSSSFISSSSASSSSEYDASDVILCNPSKKKPEYKAPCLAVPDSGSTAIFAPMNDLYTLFAAICATWTRCGKMSALNPTFTKVFVFFKLLADCSLWLNEFSDVDKEIPPITWHLGGASGEKQHVQLPASTWIGKAPVDQFKWLYGLFYGKEYPFPMPAGVQDTCLPVFAPSSPGKHVEKGYGPIWILGSPLFVGKTVSFDIKARPPAVSIDDIPCNLCDSDSKLSDDSGSSASSGPSVAKPLRNLDGPWFESSVHVL